MYRTDDPLADFDRYDYEQQKEMEQRPVCCLCNDYITDEYAFYIFGEWYCKGCFEDEFLRPVEIEE